MQDTTHSGRLALPKHALLFDVDALFVQLQGVKDRRQRRGVRYPLAPILLIVVLAKLAGVRSSREIAYWACVRVQELSRLLVLKREGMPHFRTTTLQRPCQRALPMTGDFSEDARSTLSPTR